MTKFKEAKVSNNIVRVKYGQINHQTLIQTKHAFYLLMKRLKVNTNNKTNT